MYRGEKGKLTAPSQQKYPKRWPDNRAPVIIRIDGTNLLLMIRKMRSSRPHFKYIFHYREADKQHCWFHHQSFTVSLSPSEIQYHCLTRHNVSLWWCLDCPKLKAFVLKRRGERRLAVTVAWYWGVQRLTVNSNRYPPSQKCPALNMQQSAIIGINQTVIIATNHTGWIQM